MNEELEQNKEFFNGYFSNEKLDIDEKYVSTTIDENSMTDVSKQMSKLMGPMLSAFIAVSTIFLAGFTYSLMKIITDKNTIQFKNFRLHE